MTDTIAIQEVRSLVAQGKAAQRQLALAPHEEIARIVARMLEKGRRASEDLARLEAGETGRGNLTSKIACHRLMLSSIERTAGSVQCEGIVSHDPRRKVYQIAVPLGLIAAIVPYRSPTATAIAQAIMAVRAGNCVVFAAPTGALRCVEETVKLLQSAAEEAGAPKGCLSCLGRVDDGSLDELLHCREVDFVLATSDDGTVARVNRCGKPNISVGDSNTPVYIDRSAGIAHAVRCILSSQEFDFGMAYGAEEFLCVHAAVYDETIAELQREGGHLASDEEAGKISALISGHASDISGRSAQQIARMAGIGVPPGTSALLIPVAEIGNNPLCRPKSAPVLGLSAVKNWEVACAYSLKILNIAGGGHTVAVHTTDPDMVLEFASQMPVARILVNAPAAQGAMGWATGLPPSTTLGTGSKGGCITTDNIGLRHFFQLKRVASLKEEFPLWQPGLPELDLTSVKDVAPGRWSVPLPPKADVRETPAKAKAMCWSREVPPPPLSAGQMWPRKK